jgi:antitoxin Phd
MSRINKLRFMSLDPSHTMGSKVMRNWPVQDAKARFSEFLDTCLREGPQLVTKRGAEAAVLVPVRDWRRLQRSARPTLKDLLLADEPRAEIPAPPRGRRRRRAPVTFG